MSYAIDRMAKDSWRMFRIMGEFATGFELMNELEKPTVTVFGSARTQSHEADPTVVGEVTPISLRMCEVSASWIANRLFV